MNDQVKVPEEQVQYANILFWGAWLGIALMVVTYFVYVGGVLEPHIPLEEVPNVWGLRVTEYVAKYGIPLGWGWAGLVGKGDFFNFLGIALLAGMTVICFLVTLIPAYLKQKDKPLLAVSVLEIIVLTVAASGLLGVAGH